MDELGPDPDEVEARLYLIGPSNQSTTSLAQWLPAVLETGQPAAFLLPADNHRDEALARQFRDLCASHQTAFFVQDDLQLAKTLAADGVHGSSPHVVDSLRNQLAKDTILGIDAGRSRHEAMSAGEEGADYIAFGHLGEETDQEILDLVDWWRQLFLLPCLAYAAGPADAKKLAEAGADFIGVSAAVWNGPDSPVEAVNRLRAAIEKN